MPDAGPDVELLTYKEIAERFGMTVDSARIKARRRHWQVTPGNDGLARVHVPVELIPAEPRQRQERQDDDWGALAERFASLGEQLAEALSGQQELQSRLDAARIEAAEAKAAEREARAEARLLREALDLERQHRERYEQALAMMRLPWLERVLAAMRGRRQQ
jgi:hypothetical protein